MSTGVAAMKIPDRPPMMNIATNAIALSMAEGVLESAPHIVPSQLNTLMAESGNAIVVRQQHERRPQGRVDAY